MRKFGLVIVAYKKGIHDKIIMELLLKGLTLMAVFETIFEIYHYYCFHLI